MVKRVECWGETDYSGQLFGEFKSKFLIKILQKSACQVPKDKLLALNSLPIYYQAK